MAEVSVAVLGLGRIGASVCLALKRYNAKPGVTNRFVVTGFTGDADQGRIAKESDVVERVVNNAAEAVRGADVVIVTLPSGEIDGLFGYIARDLRDGVVLLDFSRYKQAASQSAAKYFTDGVHYVGLTPTLNPKYLFDGLTDITSANEELFDGGSMFIMSSVTSAPQAVNLASDISAVLGASPQFIDMAENDALMIATETLPDVLGTAYFVMMMRSRGWPDSQRLTNPTFGMMTQALYNAHPDDLRDETLANRDALVRYIDEYMAALRDLRSVIADNDREAVASAFNSATAEYQRWLNRRYFRQWDADRQPETPEVPGLMHTLFGGFVAGKLRSKKDKSGS